MKGRHCGQTNKKPSTFFVLCYKSTSEQTELHHLPENSINKDEVLSATTSNYKHKKWKMTMKFVLNCKKL